MDGDIDRITRMVAGESLVAVVVGDVMIDRHVRCEVVGISPEDDLAPKLRVLDRDFRPGGAGNVAVNLRSMGIKNVVLTGVTGDDDVKDASIWLQETLKTEGVTPRLYDEPGRLTTTKTRYITTHGRHVCRVDHESVVPVESHDAFMGVIADAGPDVIIASDYGKGMITPKFMADLTGRFSNVPIIVDPKTSDFFSYGPVFAITPNEKEANAAVKPSEYGHDTVVCPAATARNLIITRGHRGCQLYRRMAEGAPGIYRPDNEFPTYAREIGDPTGCGDAFIAGLAVAVLAGLDLSAACRFANAAGACAYDHQGAHSVTAEEIGLELKRFKY